MRRITAYLIFSLVFLGLQANTKAQDILVRPARFFAARSTSQTFPQPLPILATL